MLMECYLWKKGLRRRWIEAVAPIKKCRMLFMIIHATTIPSRRLQRFNKDRINCHDLVRKPKLTYLENPSHACVNEKIEVGKS